MRAFKYLIGGFLLMAAVSVGYASPPEKYDKEAVSKEIYLKAGCANFQFSKDLIAPTPFSFVAKNDRESWPGNLVKAHVKATGYKKNVVVDDGSYHYLRWQNDNI